MIVKSYEVQKNSLNFLKYNFFLLYGENQGLKKDIRKFIKKVVEQKNSDVEILSLYEDEILNNEENFYNFVYTGSLFSNKKIITIHLYFFLIIRRYNTLIIWKTILNNACINCVTSYCSCKNIFSQPKLYLFIIVNIGSNNRVIRY